MAITKEQIRELMKLGLLGQGQERFGKVNYFGDSIINPLGAAQKRIVTDRAARLKSRTGPATGLEAIARLGKAALGNWEESMEREDLAKLTDFAVGWSPDTDPPRGDPIATTTALGDDFRFESDPYDAYRSRRIAELEGEHADVAEQDFVNPEAYVPTTDTYKESADYDPIESQLIDQGFPSPRTSLWHPDEDFFDIPAGPQMADVLLDDSAPQPPETWYDAIGALDLRTAAGDVARQKAILERRRQEDAAAQTAAALEAEREWEIELERIKAGLTPRDLKAHHELNDAGEVVLSPLGIQKEEETWRNRLSKPLEQLQAVNRGVGIVNRSLDIGNGTADIAAINAFQRLIDPGVVRKEDVELQSTANSLLGRLLLQVKKLEAGDHLDDPLRKKMREVANAIGSKTASNIKITIDGWKGVVDETPGLTWGRIMPPEFDQYFDLGLDSGEEGETPGQKPPTYAGTEEQWEAESEEDQAAFF